MDNDLKFDIKLNSNDTTQSYGATNDNSFYNPNNSSGYNPPNTNNF